MQIEAFGYRWTKKPSGYYQSTRLIDGKRKWLHQYTWSLENGEQPKGFHVHHIDENKDNNLISNLELISASSHSVLHGITNEWSRSDAGIEHLNLIRKKAFEWHASDDGRKWHSEHRKNISDVIFLKNKKRSCAHCGSEVMSHLKHRNVYCNRKCEFQYAQNNKRTVKNICTICEQEFFWHKKKYTCSSECRKTQAIKRREENGKIIIKCKQCGTECSKYKHGTEFCSTSCKGKFDRKAAMQI